MFYIRAPTGQVLLHDLEKCIFGRLEYLELLYQGRPHEFKGNCEYLLENSAYDKIGHFSLRLLASVSQDLFYYWIIRETVLFQKRLNYILPRQLHRLLRSIIRQLRLLTNKEKLINNTLIDVCTFFSKQFVFMHLATKDHKEECNFFQTKVRYELVPDLIKKRKVELSNGYAIIYCSKLKEVLLALFCTYIHKEVTCIKSKAQHTINQDVRLDYLYQKIHCQIFQTSHGYGHITVDNIDMQMRNFPLCMQHLYRKLRNTHRLSHYARLHYSLFLKDGGMHIEDAINYWKEEYSKPHSCSSICSHQWQVNERKFLYSIRHLYGLEGSKKNYKSPNCEFMCANVSSPMYEGGCPFKNFNTDSLKSLLSLSLTDNKVTELLSIITPQNPQSACGEFFKLIDQRNSDNIVIKSPLQYYLAMINQI
ncbi:PREDICTED: probable DNA primase large subunit [Dufourea novaeangliae]|uniref:probable DNA primase large subunit n=1 Tax=Dufourea novaeangliae TaxID=178035 RepID=UPI0007672E78|nr:PREDICTED: probable DNA primase large subunit [Dufourea novaeangliae]